MAFDDRYSGATAPQGDDRSEVQRDRDRLIHAAALRRLGGKSQIMTAPSGDFFRTRLTHSLECAQVGKAIAERVRDAHWGECVDRPEDFATAVEVGCLAHDVGHAPFGHNGEIALDSCMVAREVGRFEGNAHTFRVLTLLEPKRFSDAHKRWVGLDLTRASLGASMKYTKRESRAAFGDVKPPKIGVFLDETDADIYNWLWGLPASSTDEAQVATSAQIVDTADDIAYAVHDVEDGIWARMIPLDELHDGNEFVQETLWNGLEGTRGGGGNLLFADDEAMNVAIKRLMATVGDENDWLRQSAARHVMPRRARASLKTWGASLIERYVAACISEDGLFQRPSVEFAQEVAILKQLARAYMIDKTDLNAMKHGQRRMIGELFQAYWNDPELLPDAYEHIGLDIRHVGDNGKPLPEGARRRARIICDHIAGLTDRACLAEYGRMFGTDVPYMLLD